jgi:hypothetical protein
MRMEKPIKAAAIGMGVAGISSLYGILKGIKAFNLDPKKLEIDIFNAGFVGGWQYSAGPASLEDWINMELDAMSIADINPVKWIAKHKHNIKKYLIKNFLNHPLLADSLQTIDNIDPNSANVYIPRVVYGLYLQNVYHYTVDKLTKAGVKINYSNAKITNITPLQNLAKNDKIYDYVLLSAGHQISEQGAKLDNKIEAYPADVLKDRLTAILNAKDSQKASKYEINLKILGTSLSGIDAVFSVQSWLDELKVKNIDLYNKIKLNLKLSSRSLTFPTARVSDMPPSLLNADAMLLLCKKAFTAIKTTCTKNQFETKVLELYCNIVNEYRKNLATQLGEKVKPLTFDDIFNNRNHRCVNLSDLESKIRTSIKLSEGDNQYIINQACFRLSSKVGAFLFGELAARGLGEKYRTAYLNNVAPVPSKTLERFLSAIKHEKIDTDIVSALVETDNQKYDLLIDATNNVKMIQNHDGILKSLLNNAIIHPSGESTDPKILTSGNNKITTAIIDRTKQEGENAGFLLIFNLIMGKQYGELSLNNSSTAWHADNFVPEKVGPLSIDGLDNFTYQEPQKQATQQPPTEIFYKKSLTPTPNL